MPDKRIDESFVDQAWAQMRRLLDQEMPEEKKQRRLFPVYWMLGAAASFLLLVIVGMMWWQQYSTKSIDSTAKISTNSSNFGSIEACEIATQESMLAYHQQQAVLKQAKWGENKSQRLLSFKKDLTNRNPSINLGYHKKNPDIVLNEKNSDLLLSSLNDSSLIAISANSKTISIKNNAQINLNNELIVTPIASLAVSEISFKEVTELRSEKTFSNIWPPDDADAETPNNDLKIGIEFATYASTHAAVDGYAGGAVLDIPVQSKKLRLQAGVHINTQQRYFDSDFSADALSAVDQGNAGIGASSVVVDPNPMLSLNAVQLSFPIALQFKPFQNWSLESGLQASYLLSAQNLEGAEAYQTKAGYTYGEGKIRNLLESLTPNISNRFNVANADETPSNKVSLEQLRRLDVAVSAGVGYYPIQRLGVRLQYQRGLIDLLKAEDFKAFGNNVRLSAVYFFGK